MNVYFNLYLYYQVIYKGNINVYIFFYFVLYFIKDVFCLYKELMNISDNILFVKIVYYLFIIDVR